MTGKTIYAFFFIFPAVMLAGCISSDVRKGAVCLELGDYTSAIAFFSRVLEKDPARFEARLGMGKALLQRAIDNENDSVSWRLAVMNFEAARTINGAGDCDRLLSQVWLERAYGLLHRTDTVQAIEALTKAIAYDPKSSEPLNVAGIIYFRIGKKEKARLLFERAVRVDTAASSPLFNLGMVHWEQNEPQRAYHCWLSAIQKAPGDEVILQWFAAAEKRLRESPSAAGKGHR